MLLLDYRTLKAEQEERLHKAETANLARAAAAKRRREQPRPLFRRATLFALVRRAFA